MRLPSGQKRHRETFAALYLDVRALSEKYYGCEDRDGIINELYAYLYANCNRHKVTKLFQKYTANAGLCTTKWMEETVAFKCYDCESDSTCAQCVRCFFGANHEGHRYRLTRTSGGCCDCGDNGSWDPRGSCSRHSSLTAVEDEQVLLDMFSAFFLVRLKDTFRKVVAEICFCLQNMESTDEKFLRVLLIFLDEVVKVAPALRYALYEAISEDVLSLWVKKHQLLSVETRKTFNSLYLTMVTLMSFKLMFSKLYVKLYADIVQPFKEPEEWHLSNLSVQLFTYSSIATRAIDDGFMEVCVHPVLDHHVRDGQLDTLQFPRFDRRLFGLYVLVFSDFSYLMNHEAVFRKVLRTPALYLTLFKLLKRMHLMNTIQMATDEHVAFENSGYVISFSSEHQLHTCLRPFAEHCKLDVRASEGFYRAVNAYMLEHMGQWRFNSLKLCRTFHIPFVRFFGSIVNFNHLRQLHAADAAALRADPLVSAFDDAVLLYVLRQAASANRFAQEIKNNFWVYNGELMHDQKEHYRQVILVQLDVVAMQAAVILLGLRRRAGLTDVEPLLVLHAEAFRTHITCRENDNERIQPTPGDANFRAVMFMHLITIVLHDVKHLEKLSVARNNNDAAYVRRGYPLVVMDVVTALAMGRLEFGDVKGLVDTYWRHHPHVERAVESVATMSYSQLADKAYLRPKSESYRLVDVLWVANSNVSELSLPREVVKRGGISLLGPPRSSAFMSPEYYEAQDMLLASVDASKCLRVVIEFLEGLAGQGGGEHEHSSAHSSEPLRYFEPGVNWSIGVGSKWSDSLLSALKTVNLLVDTTSLIGHHNAPRLVGTLEAISARVGDDLVVTTSLNYSIQRLREAFQVDAKEAEPAPGEDRGQAVKKLQLKVMSRLLAQQKKVVVDGTEPPTAAPSSAEPEVPTCILCKQHMDDDHRMSFMCLVSTNSVMRRCSRALLGSSVHARSSLPLHSSMISCCGHMVHTECITAHHENYNHMQLLTMYRVQRSMGEFFCPICKALCNYTLEYVPDSQRSTRRRVVKSRLQRLCKSAWRYPYTNNWLCSPVYARFNMNPHVMYIFNAVLPCYDITASPAQGRSFLEDLGRADHQTLDFSCGRCAETEITPEYNARCRALFPRTEPQPAALDRAHIASQFSEWLAARPDRRRNLRKLLRVDLQYAFSRRVTTEYCRLVFGGQRSLFGVQNWRHVNAGCRVEPKFWMLYHHLLATCSCRRNQLTVRPSLLQQLVRNFYIEGIKESNSSDTYELDDNYFDLPPDDLLIPRAPPQEDAEDEEDGEVTMLTVLVESLSEPQLRQLVEATQLELTENETPQAPSFNVEKNAGKLPLNVTCAWSKDVLREFLLYFTQHAPTQEQSVDYLAQCVGTLTLQVLERAVLDDVKRSFATFIDAAVAQGGSWPRGVPRDRVNYRTIRFRRQFLTALYETYLAEFIEQAEAPGDLLGRVQWFGFDERREAFVRYNLGSRYTAENVVHQASPEKADSRYHSALDEDDDEHFARFSELEDEFRECIEALVSGDVDDDDVDYDNVDYEDVDVDMAVEFQETTTEEQTELARTLKDIHRRSVLAFTSPLPQIPNGDMATQVNNYLHSVVDTLMKTRKAMSFVDSGLTNAEFEAMLRVLCSDAAVPESPREEADLAQMLLFEGLLRSPPATVGAAAPERTFTGIDFVRRVNEETYRAHCNFAFFEVLRHLVPDEYHLLDFVGDDFDEQLDGVAVNDVLGAAREVARRVYARVKDKGYLHRRFQPDLDAFVATLLRHLNTLLDLAFWTIFSVFDVDEETATKVSYAHLHADDARFGLLAEVTGVKGATRSLARAYERMFSAQTRQNLALLRATGLETLAPLLSSYDYVDMERNLPGEAWELMRQVSLRTCPTCGKEPSHPIVCLLCGAVVCYHGKCCDRNKGVRVLRMLTVLERNGIAFRPSSLTEIYNDEVFTHASTCGGGQCVFISPYNCFLLFVDDRRQSATHTLYADKYGNKDLHDSVYGPVVLSQTRLARVVNSFCQGRLAHEIIAAQKEALQ